MMSSSIIRKAGLASITSSSPSTPLVEEDEWDMPTFAFHDLDYIPSGYGGILAPYIETGPGSRSHSFNVQHKRGRTSTSANADRNL